MSLPARHPGQSRARGPQWACRPLGALGMGIVCVLVQQVAQTRQRSGASGSVSPMTRHQTVEAAAGQRAWRKNPLAAAASTASLTSVGTHPRPAGCPRERSQRCGEGCGASAVDHWARPRRHPASSPHWMACHTRRGEWAPRRPLWAREQPPLSDCPPPDPMATASAQISACRI